MKSKAKALILTLSVALLVIGSVMGTLAYLTDSPSKGTDLRTALHYLKGDESCQITSRVSGITFGLNAHYTHIATAYDGTLVDAEQDVPVYVYYVPNGSDYDVYVLADDKIYTPKNSSNLFANMTQLTSLEVTNLDTSRTEDMSFLFFECTKLPALDVSGWDTSNVTTTMNMFGGDSLLTTITGLDTWDMSNVTDTANMFSDCSSLRKLDSIGTWNTGKVTAMECMFSNCVKLTDVEVSNWDVSSVWNMWGMFHACKNLTNIDISRWDVGKVTSTAEMFDGCSNLTAITVPEGMETVGEYAFADCSGLTTVTFLGDAPTLSSDCFNGVTVKVFYPCVYETWTEDVRQNYGGTITWQSHVIEEYTYNADATCTEDGTRTGVCSDCGEVFVKTAPGTATGHTFNGNKTCTMCGEANPDYVPSVIQPILTLNYPTLAFEDEILYNVYFNVDNMTSVKEMGLLIFAERNENGTAADAIETIPGFVINADGSYTVHSNGIPAKMLGDAVYFKIYAQLNDGSYVYSGIAGYHAVLYANTVLKSDAASAKAKALVVAMLNYGAAAQVDFDYKTDSLMNAGLTADHQALIEEYNESMVAAVPSATSKAGSFVNNGGYSDLHPTVSFEGAFSINYYFTPKYTPDNGVINFYYWNFDAFNAAETLTPENATGTVQMTSDGNVYTNPVEGIAAKQIDEPVYVAGLYTNGGTTYTTPVIGYSLGAYCKNIAANGNAFGAATAVYGFYAKAYFAD